MGLGIDSVVDRLRAEVLHLRDNGKGNIRVHPNSFIQVDLDPAEDSWHESHKQGHSGAMRRLHIWNPDAHDLPRQKTVNEIHDHVFDMHSTVIKGTLTQKLYWFVVGGIDQASHELYRAVYNKSSDSRLEALGIKGVLRRFDSFNIHMTQTYTQPAFTLHDSEPIGCTVTVMEKTDVHEGEASVLCPIGSPPDNSFDRASAADPDYLWQAVEASLR